MTRGRRFVAIATISALSIAANCASKTAQRQAASPPQLQQLRRDLAAIFSDPTIDHAQWSVAIESIARGDSLYRLNAQRLQVPASSQKVLTTAVAAERLGWDFSYTNRVYAAGAIADGALDGDLIVTSDGDPTINPRHPLRWNVLDEWAKQIADRGIRRVTGSIVGDDNAFAEPGWGLGWSWDDIPLGYGAPVGALQFNESQAEVEVLPGVRGGVRAFVTLTPPSSGLAVDHDVMTVPEGDETQIAVDRALGSAVVTVRGQIAMGAASRATATVAAANPTQQYVNAFRVALELRGIAVDGPALDVDDLPAPPSTAGATLLVEDRSPPLMEIIGATLKFSRNLYAETLLRTVAVHGPRSPVPGPATSEAGLQVLRETLRSWGIPNEGYLARDGSGLSRYDWISASTLTTLLLHLARDPKHADRFRAVLAVPGEPGTLQTRMVNTPLQSRVWAKTGSMSQVRSICGYLTTEQGEPLVFAILVNGFRVPSLEIDAVMDRALARVVEFRR